MCNNWFTNNWFTNLHNKIRMYSILLMCRFWLIHSDRYSNIFHFDDKWIWLSDDKWIGQNLWTFMLKDAWISNKSLWHTNAVFNIQHPWTTHSIQIIQISIQISMWNNSWTSNRWQRKIDRYHTNRNSSRLPVNDQACQPLCNMYSVIMCCRNGASMSLISCCRCRSYTRQSGNEQYRNTRRNDYRQHTAQLTMSHFTHYNLQHQYNE